MRAIRHLFAMATPPLTNVFAVAVPLLALVALVPARASAQTVLFIDNFNRTTGLV